MVGPNNEKKNPFFSGQSHNFRTTRPSVIFVVVGRMKLMSIRSEVACLVCEFLFGFRIGRTNVREMRLSTTDFTQLNRQPLIIMVNSVFVSRARFNEVYKGMELV